MHEILRNLRPNSRVLDLGSRNGSFGAECCPGAVIVRLDLSLPAPDSRTGFVQADAAHMPFAAQVFDAVIANHSLEHIDDLTGVLREISRVVRPDGSLYVAVPDQSTLSDRLYRWIYHGGGHVNPFRSAEELSAQIAGTTGLPVAGIRILYSSLWFLRREHFEPRPPRWLWLLGNGHPAVIALLTYVFRALDRWLGTRAGLYGWAFYFGDLREPIETTGWTNVCVRCGAGHSQASLFVNHRVRGRFGLFRSYDCPNCGAWNLFTPDARC